MVKKGVTAAIFCEPVQGEGGIRPAPPGFLAELRALCDDIGALLVFDEVQCGLGRTGNLWGHQWGDSQVTPDIMTLAKPLAGGLPIGAVLMTQAVADVMQPGDHGSTFAGGPLVCAAAQYTFDTIKQPAFLKRVTDRGQQLVLGLRVALANMPHVKEVRGAGLLVGIQLDTSASPVVDACRERGLLIITAGKGDIIRLVPPLTVSAAEVDQAIGILKEAIAAALPATAPTANALKH
jgi:acetylornithine aminotransferase